MSHKCHVDTDRFVCLTGGPSILLAYCFSRLRRAYSAWWKVKEIIIKRNELYFLGGGTQVFLA